MPTGILGGSIWYLMVWFFDHYLWCFDTRMHSSGVTGGFCRSRDALSPSAWKRTRIGCHWPFKVWLPTLSVVLDAIHISPQPASEVKCSLPRHWSTSSLIFLSTSLSHQMPKRKLCCNGPRHITLWSQQHRCRRRRRVLPAILVSVVDPCSFAPWDCSRHGTQGNTIPTTCYQSL